VFGKGAGKKKAAPQGRLARLGQNPLRRFAQIPHAMIGGLPQRFSVVVVDEDGRAAGGVIAVDVAQREGTDMFVQSKEGRVSHFWMRSRNQALENDHSFCALSSLDRPRLWATCGMAFLLQKKLSIRREIFLDMPVMNTKQLLLATLTLLLAITMPTTAADSKLTDGVYAEFDTAKGKIVVQLEYEKTPLTVANFVGLAEGTKHYSKDGGAPKKQDKPFYDGLNFHRVINNFMIQGGCPLGTGTGGPGYRFKDECLPTLKHDSAGILSMANAGPVSNGSQFFITHGPTPHLDGKHTVFVRVVQGQDVVNAIVRGDKINSIKIVRVGDKAKAYKGDQADFEKFSK
jgi:cyclophilin family peptidyl-prolyl cis-trans isomerase